MASIHLIEKTFDLRICGLQGWISFLLELPFEWKKILRLSLIQTRYCCVGQHFLFWIRIQCINFCIFNVQIKKSRVDGSSYASLDKVINHLPKKSKKNIFFKKVRKVDINHLSRGVSRICFIRGGSHY